MIKELIVKNAVRLDLSVHFKIYPITSIIYAKTKPHLELPDGIPVPIPPVPEPLQLLNGAVQ